MFYHAYDSYMEHAYPWDELRPLTCEPRRWDRRERGTLDDSLGGYALVVRAACIRKYLTAHGGNVVGSRSHKWMRWTCWRLWETTRNSQQL